MSNDKALVTDKETAKEILRIHEICQSLSKLSEMIVTDVKPDWINVFRESNNDLWYCIMPASDQNQTRGSRVVCISKSSGKIVFDGYCGE
jgi:hypothetical protein